MNSIQFEHEPRHILVTGGAGFIGSHVVRQLRQRWPDALIRVLHQPRENLANLQDLFGLELIPGDITSTNDMRSATMGCDVVFHLAAIYAFWLPDMSVMHRVNVEGTRTVLQAALEAGVRRVVYTSSAVCFAGHGDQVRATESSPFAMQISPYAVSKHHAHQVALEFVARGLNVVLVCPVAPVGPGDIAPTPTGRMIIDMFKYPLPLSPVSEMNVIDVRDCAKGHLLALTHGRCGESYLLAGENYTYHDLLRRAMRLCGQRKPIITLPLSVLRPASRVLLFTTRFTRRAPVLTPVEVELTRMGLVCDGRKAREELGLAVRPIESTLSDALAWFASQGHLSNVSVSRRALQLAEGI